MVAIKKAGKTGKARIVELRKVRRKMGEGKMAIGPKAVSLGWVKSHIGIKGNKEADKKAKLRADKEDPTFLVITEGGLKEGCKKMRREDRYVTGTGGVRVVKWERKARMAYLHCRTSKGNLQSWEHKLDETNNPTCRFCGNHMKTGKHVALVCPYGEEIGGRCSSWEEMDEKKWLKKVKNRKKECAVDLVEAFFSNLDLY